MIYYGKKHGTEKTQYTSNKPAVKLSTVSGSIFSVAVPHIWNSLHDEWRHCHFRDTIILPLATQNTVLRVIQLFSFTIKNEFSKNLFGISCSIWKYHSSNKSLLVIISRHYFRNKKKQFWGLSLSLTVCDLEIVLYCYLRLSKNSVYVRTDAITQ